ncbi:hypothetical protein ACVXHB_24055 [Escherichia coli]
MERNVTLDFVRGVAILGILLLTFSAFGLPKAAYLNPAWYSAYAAGCMSTGHFLILSPGGNCSRFLRCCLVRACKCCCPVADADPVAVNAVSLVGLYSRFTVLDGDILLAYGLVS